MKFAFSSNAFRKYSLEETISWLAGTGYKAIEIMADVPHAWPLDLKSGDRKQIVNSLKKYNMEISNINAFMMCAIQDFHHPSWIETDKDYRQKRIQHTIDCIYLAEELGAKTISTEPGGPVSQADDADARANIWNGAMKLFIEGIEEVIPHARKTGVKLLIEPEPDLLIQRSDEFDEFMKFIQEIDRDIVGMNFDVGHFFCVGEDPVETLNRMYLYTEHFHLEDIASTREHRHLVPGEGAIDLHRFLDAVKAKEYQGYITVELYPYQDNPVQIAEQSLKYLRNWESGSEG